MVRLAFPVPAALTTVSGQRDRMSLLDAEKSAAELAKLEAELDPEMQFRPLGVHAGWLVAGLLFVLSCFHYYTAGFGLLPEVTHRGIHLAFVLGLIFLVFPFRRMKASELPKSSLLYPLGISIVDWLLAIGAVVSSLYVPWVYQDLVFRIGNPDPADWIMGTIMIVVLLEATRRAVGIALPIIAASLMIYALYGPYLPGVFAHPGNTWKSVVNHLYLTSVGNKLKIITTWVSFGGVILDLVSPWLISYVSPLFVLTMLTGDTLMTVGFLIMMVIPLYEMWVLNQPLLAGKHGKEE